MISVIVPVYKVEPYLRRCVDSILAQTFTDFELILVDDGSPDNCPAICDEYAATDKRVKVIHKTNGGVSSARNAGLDVAVGEYVLFVDSDDWLLPAYLCGLLHGNWDLICQAPNCVTEDGTFKYKGKVCPCRVDHPYAEQLERMILDGSLKAASCKRYKLELIQRHHLRFDTSLDWAEDTLFTVQYALAARTILVEDVANYQYVHYTSRQTLSNSTSDDRLATVENSNRKIAGLLFPKDQNIADLFIAKRMSVMFSRRVANDFAKVGRFNVFKKASLFTLYKKIPLFIYTMDCVGIPGLSKRDCQMLKQKNYFIILFYCIGDAVVKTIRKIGRLFIENRVEH